MGFCLNSQLFISQPMTDWNGKGAMEEKDVASPTNGTLGIPDELSQSRDQVTHEAEVHTTAAPSAVGPTTPVHEENHEVERITLASSPATDSDLSDEDPIKK